MFNFTEYLRMKRFTLVLGLLLTAVAAFADNASDLRPMLVQGKTWYYVYHQLVAEPTQENDDPSNPEDDGYITYTVWYTLRGETVIDGRTYMKLYRHQEWDNEETLSGYYREEDGKVYVYNESEHSDRLLIDFTLQGYDDNPIGNVTVVEDKIRIGGELLRRYHYLTTDDSGTHDTGIIGVEGVGFRGTGLVQSPVEVKLPGIDDYEEFAGVTGGDIQFTDAAFNAPKYIALTEAEQQFVVANNDFAFNLFRKARGNDDMILSPLSITFALGMLNNGADGQTLSEINQVLGGNEASADDINQYCHLLMTEFPTIDESTKALLANTIFVNTGKGYQLQPAFVQTANDYYDAKPQSRDFADGETMDVINQWSSDHTMGMIPKVLTEDTFNPDAISYLLNAIYFKGAWSSPFKTDETRNEAFNDGEEVPMMHKLAEYSYTENDLYQAVKLPYGNGGYQMTVYLPREGKSLNELLGQLNAQNWQMTGMAQEVDLKLPSFETDTNLPLKDIMSALGMPKAFTQSAEFPYFCNKPSYIAMMLQVAKIKVDEEGTEAAAVTIIEMDETSISDPKHAEFHANRPFFYVISEQSTGAILFMGQYVGNAASGIQTPLNDITDKTTTSPSTDHIYNLAGQRLSTPPTRGLYIRGGKKHVVTE
jgi:serpin B